MTSPRALCSQLAAENFRLHHQLGDAAKGLAVYDDHGRLDAVLSPYPTCVLCIDRIRPAASEIALETRLNALGAVRRTPKVDLFCRHDPVQVYLGSVAVLAEFPSIADAEFAQGILHDQILSGQPIRVRFGREFPTATIAAFGAICALPEAVVRAYFARFGPVRQLTMQSPIAEGWILVRFRHLRDAVNCLILIRHKIIAGSLVEAHFADDIDDDEVGEPDPISQQMARFDEIRSDLFSATDTDIDHVLERNNRLLRLIDRHLKRVDEARLPLQHADCLRLYLNTRPAVTLSDWITDTEVRVLYTSTDEEHCMQLFLHRTPLLERDVRFYLDTIEYLQDRAEVDSHDLNQLLPYSDFTARKISVTAACHQALVLYLNRTDWMRPRAQLLYWLLNLRPDRQPLKSDRLHIRHVLRFALYNANRSQVGELCDFVQESGRTVDEFLQQCERIPSAMIYMSVAGAGHTKPALNSSLVFDDVGRRWLDFKHRVQYASIPLYDQSGDWPGPNIIKRAEALNKILQTSRKPGRHAFRVYARLLCYIDDCIGERERGKQHDDIDAEATCHQSFESRVLFGLSRLQTRRLRRASSAALTRSRSQAHLSAAAVKRKPCFSDLKLGGMLLSRPKSALAEQR